MIWWIVDDAPIVGGAELFAMRLGRHLSATGDDVSFLTPAGSAFGERVTSAGLRLIDHSMAGVHPRSGISVPVGVRATRKRLIEARRMDAIVLANTAGAQAYVAVAAATLRRRPRIVHVLHEQMTAARLTARVALRHIGALVATGENTAAVYEAALGGREVGRLNNFLPVDAFRANSSAIDRRVPPVIGVLGRMIPEKGILELIDELSVAGSTWGMAYIAAPAQDAAYASRVIDRIRELDLADRIRVRDWAEPTAFIDQVDVVVVPSTGLEGQPTVILEALARARPVVIRAAMWSTDFDGLPVLTYRNGGDLAGVLQNLPGLGAEDLREAARRFGPDQAVASLVAAAQRAGSRR